jgi:hypothetical protein
MWDLFYQDSEICFFRNCQNKVKEFFSQKNDLVLCKNVCSVIQALRHQHDPTEWRLFLDSSKVSLKAVFLHNGNKFPSVPVTHAANIKESYENWQLGFENIQYEKYNRTFAGI